MTGDDLKKPVWVLTSSRAGSWFFAIFYTSFLAFEIYEAVARGLSWQWLLAAGFVLLSVFAWVSLVWVLRHPQPPPGRTPSVPPRTSDRDDD
jgi:hypothetical protein